MDYLGQAAHQLREFLARQAWLDALQPAIARVPDWALLAAGPILLLVLAHCLRLIWPKRQARRATVQMSPTPKPSARAEAPPLRSGPRVTPAFPAPEPTQEHKAAVSPSRQAPATATAVPPTPAPKPERAETAAALPISTPSADEDEDNRSVRVFVSSTFLDMQAERDELVTKSFPALRAKYRARGVEVFEVDLRWGIIREQMERGETLPTLLAEIDRCRPYFIGLLGDRYGWVPPASALTDKLRADYPAIARADGMSITAMEIMHGVLADPDTAARAVFFERDPQWDWIATLDEADRAAAAVESEEARGRLSDIKDEIRRKARVEPYARPEEIQQMVFDALDGLLASRFPETEAPDAFELSARLHRAYARERRALHVGAEGYLRDLNQWMETEGAPPMLITGASGGGKSTLVANWLNASRSAHPESRPYVFEHYLGASPDSADPMLLMRRLWEHLNRATGETVDAPAADAELMDVSVGLAQRLAQARAMAARSGARILIALDGLDKLSSEQNLRWLPLVPGVHVLASGLDGEAKTAALGRGFAPLEVKSLTEAERRDFITGTLRRWRRDLEPHQIPLILNPAAPDLAGSPLYLKTVLDELRVSADRARLNARLDHYRSARDMPDLFDRVLQRLEEDCEPGLAAKALPLIWASRAGLEETEIAAIAGASPLGWAILRNGLSDGLRDQQGRIAFSHDYLRQAVETRYLRNETAKRAAHLAIADRFEAHEPDARQAEELPFQLRAAQAWERLEVLLVDLDRFSLLRARGDGELLSYWLPLKERGRDPEALLCDAFEARTEIAPSLWAVMDILIAFSLGEFLSFAGAPHDALQRLGDRRTVACEAVFGLEHPRTLKSLEYVAATLHDRGDFEGAQKLFERVVELMTRTLGPEHLTTANSVLALAKTCFARGDFQDAQRLEERVLEVRARVLGLEDPHTVDSMNSLAGTLKARGDLDGAQRLFERVVEASSRAFGPEHPSTLMSMGNLAATLQARGDLKGAQVLQEQVFESITRVLGPEHPRTLTSMSNLAGTLYSCGDLEGAQKLEMRVLEARERAMGPEHPETLMSTHSIAQDLYARGDLGGAQRLFEHVLKARERRLGAEHPDTLMSLSDLATTLSARGDLSGAQNLFGRALDTMSRALGSEHPMTLNTAGNLASVLSARGDLEGAKELEARTFDVRERILGPEHPDTLTSMNNLAAIYQASGDPKGAQELWDRALKTRMRILGPEHPHTLITMDNLAGALRDCGELDRAQHLHERALETLTRKLGPNHPDTLTCKGNLAATLRARGGQAGTDQTEEEVLAKRTHVLGPDHPSTLESMGTQAQVLYARGDFEGARELQERALEARTRNLGPEHPDTLKSMNNLAGTLYMMGDFERAQGLLERVLSVSMRTLGPEDPRTRATATSLAIIRKATRRTD